MLTLAPSLDDLPTHATTRRVFVPFLALRPPAGPTFTATLRLNAFISTQPGNPLAPTLAAEILAAHLLLGEPRSKDHTGEHRRQLSAGRDEQRRRIWRNWAALARKWSTRLSKLSAKDPMLSTSRCFKTMTKERIAEVET